MYKYDYFEMNNMQT